MGFLQRALVQLMLFQMAAAVGAQTIPAATEGRPFNSNDRLVVAYVFAWYTPTTGQTLGVWHPLEGRVEWDGTVDFWTRQVKDLMDANVDLIYVHLINSFATERANLYTALRDLRTAGYRTPQVAPWLDPAVTFHPINLGPIDLCVAADLDLYMDQFEDFYQTYLSIDPGGEPFLATMNGKPMLNVWAHGSSVSNVQCLPRSTFENELLLRLGSLFGNGVHMASITPPSGFTWADEFNRAFVGFTGSYYLLNGAIAVHKPGQWDQLDRFLARNGGTDYAAGWDDLIADGTLRQVQIESWNEYTEGTGIFEADPTKAYWQEDGFQFHPDTWGPAARTYIDLTAEKGALFNNLPELDAEILHLGDPPVAVDLGETFSLQAVVRNAGDAQWRGSDGYGLSVDWGNGFGASFLIDDTSHEIDQRDDPLFAGHGGYGGVFRGRPIVFDLQVRAPTISGLYRPVWRMVKSGTPFGASAEQVVQVGEADACASTVATTTVFGTLGIHAYGSNRFCADLGEPQRTADFICTHLGFAGALDFESMLNPLDWFCAYKTEADTPNFGLSGNWGHGSRTLSQVRCAPASCGVSVFPTTVFATLGIHAFGNNCFAGDLGDPERTADFICTQKGYDRSIGYRTGPKTASQFCAYKTEASTPHFGLSGNWGHGSEQLDEVLCVH